MERSHDSTQSAYYRAGVRYVSNQFPMVCTSVAPRLCERSYRNKSLTCLETDVALRQARALEVPRIQQSASCRARHVYQATLPRVKSLG